MNKKAFGIAALAFLAVALVAFQCPGLNISIGGTPIALETPPPPPPTTAPTTPTPVVTERIVLLRDDWTGNDQGWGTYGPDEVGNEIFVGGGAYHFISIFEPGIDNLLYGWTSVAFIEDFDLVVTATQVEGTNNNEIAVIFGLSDQNNFYEFAYSGDGYVGLFQYTDGQASEISSFAQSGAIIQGNATNEVRVVVDAGVLTAYINGQQVLVNDVTGYTGGYIGFGCGPFEEPRAHCTFDNVEVLEPA